MKKSSQLSAASILITMGLLLGTTTPAIANEPCTFSAGGSDVDVSGCNFAGRDFFNAVFDRSNFSGTNLSGVRSRYSYWVNTNLANANMRDIILFGAYMPGSNFDGADLSRANLASSYFENANFANANLTGVVSGGVTGTPSNLPAGWILSGGYFIGPGANLSGANLTGVNLTGADLTGANLTGVRSGGIVGEPSTLPEGWGLVGGYLFGPEADLSGARLDGLSIWGVNLSNANLQGASINQTAINNSDLTGIRSGGLLGTFQQVGGIRVQNGYLVNSTANLAKADLRGADLSELDLSGANLTGADLTGANLSNAFLANAVLVNTNLTFANLTGVNLSGATISFSNFNGANFTNANLSSITASATEFYQTNFTNTDLFGATLTSARSGGIVGEPLTLPIGIRIIEGEITNVFTASLNPAVAGTFTTGSTIEASFEGIPAGATVSYQWLRDSFPIQGANTATYLVTPIDVEKRLSVMTTVTKHSFLPMVEISPVAIMSRANIIAGTVNISGVMKQGKVIKAIVRPWVNTLGIKYRYQWLRNGKEIKFATKTTYRLTPADAGANVSVRVSQSVAGYNAATQISGLRKIAK